MGEREKKIEELRARLRERAEYERAHRVEMITEAFGNLKPFTGCDDIPDLPKLDDAEVYRDVVVRNLIRCGAIPKARLVVGRIYEGKCRNADRATWDGSVFRYMRRKFGAEYEETINHFEDDNGYDLFVPIREIEDEC